MLAITRKVGQEVHIGDDIVIKVVEISDSGQVRLALKAPLDVKIRRPEAQVAIAEPLEELK